MTKLLFEFMEKSPSARARVSEVSGNLEILAQPWQNSDVVTHDMNVLLWTFETLFELNDINIMAEGGMEAARSYLVDSAEYVQYFARLFRK